VSELLLHQRLLELGGTKGDRVALIDGDRRVSFEELAFAATGLAGRLREAGVGSGDRVAIVSENSAEYAITTLGTWMAGAAIATVYPPPGRASWPTCCATPSRS
jgi:acyl-CoA synthetase (AMP-forming)/AMP-acid ligase II